MSDPDPAGLLPTTGPPRWVKVFGLIALVVVVVMVVMLLTGSQGGHGPGRHMLPPALSPTGV